MSIIALIFAVIYIIWLNSLIRFGIKTASRIAAATESSAANLAFLAQILHDREIERVGVAAVEQALAKVKGTQPAPKKEWRTW